MKKYKIPILVPIIFSVFIVPQSAGALTNPTFGNFLPRVSRTGTTVMEPRIPSNQTKLFFSLSADPLLIKEPRALKVTIEQIPDVGDPWTFGEIEVPNVRQALTTPGKNGKPPKSITLDIEEQIMRGDIVGNKWKKRRAIRTANDTYYQMAMDKIRITIRVIDPKTGRDADLAYSATVKTEDKKPTGLPTGHRSASLLGTFPGNESTSATTVTTTSRTSVAGSLIVGFGGSWQSGGAQNNTITDTVGAGCPNPCNTFVETIDFQFDTTSRITLAYNIGGTRGASHTIKNTKTGAANSISVGGGEFSGIEASPTVVSNTASGSSNAPSVAVTAGASSLYVGITGYNTGGPFTITENTGGGWALVIEADENNDGQAINSEYKVGITGANTASWSLSGSGAWGAALVAFTEVVADVTAPTITNISSNKANATYGAGEIIDIDVTFSEAVTSTGDVTVTLETGAIDRTCTFTVTAATTGTCNYTVQAGDSSADLTVATISGTINDAADNPMTNFVPTTNLAANKALVIDAPPASGSSRLQGGLRLRGGVRLR